MNKMKKALLLALSLAMSATLFAACGKDKGNNNSSSGSSETSSSIEDSSSSESEGSSSSIEDSSSSESEDSSSSVEDSSSSVEDSSSSESEDSSEVTPAINPFTKVINKADRENGYVVVDLEEGAALDLTDPDAVEGKVFKGWVDAEGNSITATTMPAEALTIYANWEITPYTVTVKDEEGAVLKTYKFGVEDVYVDGGENDIIGIDSLTWYIEQDYAADYKGIPATWELKDCEITLTAKAISTFTKVINRADRVSGIVVASVTEGEALDLTDPDEVEGKTFLGWVDAEGKAIAEDTVMPAEDLTIYANWSVNPYTLTVKDAEGAVLKTYTFGVEDVMATETTPEIIGIDSLTWVLETDYAETAEVEYVFTGIPETWALEDCEITVEATYSDLASYVSHWDRLNQNIIDATGKINQNVGNYWDGSDNSVSVALQGEVTNGSSLATKLSFNVTKLTEEQRAATLEAWSGWKDEMWVGFKVPVGGVNLSNYELVFDMKLVNTNPDSVIAYAMSNYDGEEAAFVTGKYDNNTTYKQSNMVDLGDGWYRWTITVDCSTAAGQKADYIVLSLDNTAKDIDKTQDSVAYIDNMSLVKVTYYEISLDGQVERVKEGTEYTLKEPVREGYEFLGWVDGENNIVPTGTFKVTENVTLTATWKKLPVQAGLYMPTAFDLGEEDYVLAQFSGNPGTYNIVLEGGCIAKAWDGENVGEAITTITLMEENTTVTFAICFVVDDEGMYTDGTILMTIPAENATVLDTAIRSATFTGTEVDVTNGETYNIKYSTTEVAPAGFSKVTEITWVPSEDGWGDCKAFYYLNNSVDINNYSDVYFAVKLSQNRNCFMIEIDDTVARYHNYYGGDWLQIHLYQAEDGKWSKDFVAPGFESKGEVTGVTGENLMKLMVGTSGKLSMPRGQAKNTAGLTSIVWVTDVVLVEKPAAPAPVAPFEIPETAKVTGIVPFRSYFVDTIADTGSIEKAVGFDTVVDLKFKSERWAYTTSTLSDQAYEFSTDLSVYTDVWFALKLINAKFVCSVDIVGTEKTADGNTYTETEWVYFHFAQNENGTWTVTLKWSDQTKVFENQVGTTIQKLLHGDGWAHADGASIMIQRSNTTDENMIVDIYSTEIMGVKKEVAPFDMSGAENIIDHVWQATAFDGTNETTYTKGEDYVTNYSTEKVPVGFSKVTQTTWTPDGNTNPWSAFQAIDQLNMTSLTGYSDVYLAMKAGENAKIDFGKNNFYTGGAWLYIHAQQTGTTEDNKPIWTITYATADGSATPVTEVTGITATNLVTLLSWGGATCTPRHMNNKLGVESESVPATIYFTNLVGVAKA